MSLNSTLKSILTGLVFAGIFLAAPSCNHPDNEINATCFDEKKNQDEERVDCGGPNCDPCPPTCDDGVLNQDEEAVDCGGPNCPDCGSCTDGVQSVNWVPQLNSFVTEQGIDCGFPCTTPCPPTCEDGIQNGNEEGIDCGGDCDEICPEPSCFDGVWNGTETGVDCGPDCPPCAVPTCSDGIMNQNETGIDCGGICQTLCPDPTCTDGIMNGNEVGIDCGGWCPTTCPVEETCNDGILNNGEEWIDCGGPNCPNVCPTCADEVQNGPEAGVDCVEEVIPEYSGGGCIICETCYDGMQNRDESGVDCGGVYCDDCEMYLNATSLDGSIFEGVNFTVQENFDGLTFSATQTIGSFTRSLTIKVPLSDDMDEGDSAPIEEFAFDSPSVQYINANGVVFESLDTMGEMTITIKTDPASQGPSRIEGVIDMTEMEDVDFTSTATETASNITFGINF